MSTFIIRGDVQKDAVRDLLLQIPTDGSITVEFKKTKKGRSVAQNALYWKWITTFGRELGYSKDEMHEVLTEKLLPTREITDLDGNELTVRTSTKSLKVEEFGNYLNDIDRLAAQQGILLPHPEDLYYEAMGYGS